MPASTGALERWGALGAALIQYQARSRYPAFAASVATLVKAGRALRAAEFAELEEIIEQCQERLKPLGEPLKEDLGLNRWLVGAREETYSDWLAWLLGRMTVEELAAVLGLPELKDLPEPKDIGLARIRISREVKVEYGQEDRKGRLDILIQLGQSALVVIEVKRGPAEDADLRALHGYRKAVEHSYRRLKKLYILLVTEAAEKEIKGFQVRLFPYLCRNLRRLAMDRMKAEHIFAAAMALMVSAAIEANLLGFSVYRGSFTAATVDHLRKFVGSADYE